MEDKPPLGEVTAALAALKAEGTFAVEESCASDNLRIEVAGVGPVRFPISAATARKLCAVARQAPFGRRDETLYDKRVRDTWQLDERQVVIDADAWKSTLDPLLARLRDRLGFAKRSKLRAVFDKMLVYAPGQFFAAHQDSERARDMVGGLVVELPSKHEGGAMIVQHRDEKLAFRGAPRSPQDLSILAFYADCHHEVEPIQSGYRIVLTYHLHHSGGPSKDAPRDLAALVDRLAESVEAYFSTPPPPTTGSRPGPPDRLIYLLDHEYTQQSLGWNHLKNADRLRVSALRQVADRLDCEAFLALADVHEHWSCEGDWGQGGDDEAEDEAAEEDYELTELIEDDVELRHWVNPEGKALPGVSTSAWGAEVCFTLPSVEMNPWQSEHEGYMGNYGNTVDRYYHRAALVMWPKAKSFVLRARVSPSWAVGEIAESVAAGDVKGARAKAKSVLRVWGSSVDEEKHAAFFQKLCEVLGALDDADLASKLLAPFGPQRLTASNAPLFVSLVERFGITWAQRLFSKWAARTHYGPAPGLPSLPRLCDALSASTGEHGKPLASWLLEREVTSFEKRYRGSQRLPGAFRDHAEAANERTGEIFALFDAARVLAATQVRDRLVAFLTAPKTALPLLELGALLQTCREGRTPAEVRAFGLHALHRHAVVSLEQALTKVRSLDDWSIDPPHGCHCELCKQLATFLRARDRIEYAWPLAQDRRRHIHNVIDTACLPVTHTTIRSGRPQTLVLQKQNALFEREAILRERQKMLSTWLQKQRASFSERG